jgi:tRNA-Thr(GGU) m(6)t(6)A37 methyltransferase TsaA
MAMMNELPSITFQPIGIVRNELKERGHHNVDNIVSEIVIDPNLTEGLDKLTEFSHITVIYFMHQSHKPAPMKVHPKYHKGATLVGVFASRSPDRPNPLGKTIVKLLERHNNVLKVQGLDAMDGSPVIDIKPYIPEIDSAADAKVPPWMK